MKLTNVSTKQLYLNDLTVMKAAQNEGRRGENRYLEAGDSVYLPNTSQVLRSAIDGTIQKWVSLGYLQLEDVVALAAFGGADTAVLTHNFNYPVVVQVLKQVGQTWVDATGTYDAIQNAAFTTVTITNTTAFALTFLVRFV